MASKTKEVRRFKPMFRGLRLDWELDEWDGSHGWVARDGQLHLNVDQVRADNLIQYQGSVWSGPEREPDTKLVATTDPEDSPKLAMREAEKLAAEELTP